MPPKTLWQRFVTWFTEKRLAVYVADIRDHKHPIRKGKFYRWWPLPRGYRWF